MDFGWQLEFLSFKLLEKITLRVIAAILFVTVLVVVVVVRAPPSTRIHIHSWIFKTIYLKLWLQLWFLVWTGLHEV